MEPIKKEQGAAFGKMMKERRKVLKIKQDDLAKVTGTSRAALSYYENGERTPDIHTAANIARVLGLSLDELAGLKRNKNKKEDAVDPIVQIYRESPVKYRVMVDGEEIENLKSFSVQISNERKFGAIESPHYTAEIYLPIKAPEPMTWNGMAIHKDSLRKCIENFEEQEKQIEKIEYKEENEGERMV